MLQVDNRGTWRLELDDPTLQSKPFRDYMNTVTKFLSISNLDLHLQSGLMSQDWPLNVLKPQKQNTTCLQMGLNFFLLTTQENVGCFSGKNRLSLSCPCQGYEQKNLEETPKLGTCDFTWNCFLFKNIQTFQKKGQISSFRIKVKRQPTIMEELKNNHNCNSRKMSGSVFEALGHHRCLLVCHIEAISEENKSRPGTHPNCFRIPGSISASWSMEGYMYLQKYMSVSYYATFSRVGCCI